MRDLSSVFLLRHHCRRDALRDAPNKGTLLCIDSSPFVQQYTLCPKQYTYVSEKAVHNGTSSPFDLPNALGRGKRSSGGRYKGDSQCFASFL